jgi:hypothetical protein
MGRCRRRAILVRVLSACLAASAALPLACGSSNSSGTDEPAAQSDAGDEPKADVGAGGKGGADATPGDVASNESGDHSSGGESGIEASVDAADAAEAAEAADDAAFPEDAKTGNDAAEAGDAACGSMPEQCDGVDNNCNGAVDEGDPGGGLDCNVPGKAGPCAKGLTHCQAGQIKCIQINPPAPEVCNDIDDDCSGVADDNLTDIGAACSTGMKGACATGTSVCVQAALTCAQTTQASAETCNGIDDDCNGTVDDGMPGAGQPCKVPGVVAGTPCADGQSNCLGGANGCTQLVLPSTELCNGIDDDCSGIVDDPGVLNGKPCMTSQPGVCATGSTACVAGNTECVPDIAPGSQPETCDAKDNDCNGAVDDVPNLKLECSGKNPGAVNVQTWQCNAGACIVQQCLGVFRDCDGLPSNGCETDTSTNSYNCGMCGKTCLAPHGTASCSAAQCEVACNPGWGNCDNDPSNGCERPLTGDIDNCGACGNHCESTTGTASCPAGICQLVCAAGRADCDGTITNGCEVVLATDPAHCGTCGKACNTVGGIAGCAAGQCTIACSSGRGDCDGDATNGCEVNLNAEATHCGSCGTACSSVNGQAGCNTGQCSITCNSGFANCNGQVSDGCEVNLTNSPANCGGCGLVCSSNHGVAGCNAGSCTIACNAGYSNCDANALNGCEVDTATDPAHCGSCSKICSQSHGTAGCAAGQCTITCAAGWADCDTDPSNGCEVDLKNDPAHCGACTTVCNSGGGTPACNNGVCGIMCQAGLGDCDGNTGNGCETNLNTSLSNCGGCGHACSSAGGVAACNAGSCTITCNTGFSDCDGNVSNGCEVNTPSDPAHCGSCSSVCSQVHGTGSCSSGKCAISCASGWADCDANVATGCEQSTASDVSHCGTCTNVCNSTNGTPSCISGSCQIACNTGWGNCDGNAANGCEVNTSTDGTHCGNCSSSCGVAPSSTCASASTRRVYSAPGTCSSSTCVFPYVDSACNTPPSPVCASGTTLRTWQASGTCALGTCSYAYADSTCSTPPATTCASADVRRTYDAAGACASGACSYTSHDAACSTPPAATCVNNTTVRTYVNGASDCLNGDCVYSYTDTPCVGACTSGACSDPCGAVQLNYTFESGAQGFTHKSTSSMFSSDPWKMGTATLTTCHGGTTCWGAGLNSGYDTCQSAELDSPTIDLSACATSPLTVTLSFWHWFHIESDGYDGGLLQISSNNGATWQNVIPTPGYTGLVDSSTFTGCGGAPYVYGRSAWYGLVPGGSWTKVTLTLGTQYRVSAFRFRFVFGSDDDVTDDGWFIDDVSVTAN